MAISYRAAQTLIKRGDEAGLRSALDSGLDPNLKNQNGWTLLMLSAVEGHVALGHALLEKGADAALRNAKGEDAASLSAQKGHEGFTTLLATHA